jgi:hypothetical protein
MAYNAVAQREQDALSDAESMSGSPPLPPLLTMSAAFQPLQMDFDNFGSGGLFMEQELPKSTTGSLTTKLQSIIEGTNEQEYEMVEDEDYSIVSREPTPAALTAAVSKDDIPITKPSSPVLATEIHVPKRTDKSQEGLGLVLPRPIRTASLKRPDLRHPTPDLQALQGAYVANVEHLEKTAEQLSMTSSIEDAIRNLHDEQKRSDSRRSSLLVSPVEVPWAARQVSNPASILELNNAARSGGYSPGGFNIPQEPLVVGRLRSGSRGSNLISHTEAESEVKQRNASLPSTSHPQPNAIAEEDEAIADISQVDRQQHARTGEHNVPIADKDEDERPTTSGSISTLEKARSLFNDFDGEHYDPGPPALSEMGNQPQVRRVSSGNLMSSNFRPKSFADPLTGTQMVYYPAPVPMMLNLPQKLSNRPSARELEKRRTQVLSAVPAAARKSTAWLPDVVDGELVSQAGDEPELPEGFEPQHHRRSMGGRKSMMDMEHVPAHLRASQFFEIPGIKQTVEVKSQSAVATLDSILDASAFAPVNAFTDHAFAGKLGAEVYGGSNKRASRLMSKMPGSEGDLYLQKNRKSLSNLLLRRQTSSNELLGGRRSTMIRHHDAERSDGDENYEEGDEDDEDEDDEEQVDKPHPDDVVYQGAPTTLLAELQIRKQQMKQRTRPITSQFPNGVHSTLLELDAVAQVEKRNRHQKRVALAWEEPSATQEQDDDEDVPLAMLYPPKTREDPNRPLGLIQRKELEDNEPLSARRNRLLGRPVPLARASTMMSMTPDLPEDENETLAQRAARLKGRGSNPNSLPPTRPVSGDFASEMISQFGGVTMKDAKGRGRDIMVTDTPEEEETLGQRRKRLQAEREARAAEVAAGSGQPSPAIDGQPTLKKKLSMADILAAHPASRASSGGRMLPERQSPGSAGLLAMHEREKVQRASTMNRVYNQQGMANSFVGQLGGANPAGMASSTNLGMGMPRPGMQRGNTQPTYGFGTYKNLTPPQPGTPVGGYNLGGYAQQQMMMPMALSATGYPQMGYGYGYPGAGMGIGMNMTMGGVGYQNPMMWNGMGMGMGMGMAGMGMGGMELNQGQIEMVERWRQSVMQ